MSQLVLVLIVANVLASVKGFSDEVFFNKYKFQVGKIQAGEQIRMLTSGFLHADWLHIGFNMYALWMFGQIVENSFSAVYFLLIYFGSLFAGNLYSMQQHKDEPYYSAVGASGAVSGIVFSAIMLRPEMELMMLPIPFYMPGYVFGIGYLLYSIYGMKNRVGNIGHSAHLGGAIAGYALTLLLRPSVYSNNTTMVLIMGAIVGGLLFFGDKLKLGK